MVCTQDGLADELLMLPFGALISAPWPFRATVLGCGVLGSPGVWDKELCTEWLFPSPGTDKSVCLDVSEEARRASNLSLLQVPAVGWASLWPSD